MRGIAELICGVSLVLVSLAVRLPAAESENPARYSISATSAVTVSVPGVSKGRCHVYRNAQGKWVPLPNVREAAGTVTFTLSPEQMAGGKTVVLLNKPQWLVAEDCTPPKVTEVVVDGRRIAPSGVVDLGWFDAAPRTLELQVVDLQNPLDARSVTATVGGRTIGAGPPGLSFLPDPKDKKKGRIVCSLPRIGASDLEGSVNVTIQCDDFAPDDADCKTTFTFTVTRLPQIDFNKAAATTKEGIKIYVDSVHPGYENVDCMLDGQLQAAGTTTFGSTWASTETNTAHWMCFMLPESREVSGLEISWANYQSTFWASNRYLIATWDGKQWAKALKVDKNPAGQTSRHSLAPTRTDRVLVWVPAGGNHPQRPDLMWVTEVKLLP